MKLTVRLLFILSLPFALSAQQNYKVGAIGFYNFENLFDTLDTENVRDTEFTPSGERVWNTERYTQKLDRLAKVVAELATEVTPDGVAVLGVSEIENRSVLEDFVAHPLIKDRGYQIVHEDSPDLRGIDVALIYNPRYFTVLGHKMLEVELFREDGSRRYTRDVMLVSGTFDGDPIHIMVNHWPSRSGGEAASQPGRNKAAMVCKMAADSIMAQDPEAKIIIMGDLNDDPVSPSVKEVIGAKFKRKKVGKGEFYNPMYDLYRKGIGTLAYRDTWSLFDQLLLSYGLANPRAEGYRMYQVKVHNPNYLFQKHGRFKGYPFRTFGGSEYLGGYSDHFPVYLLMIKPAA
ncbi:endonuclease/exonuclease/phosphatase family protein [Phaeodactylibacter luteus]|uniref:Endonuclease/exonuclease/phosphatase family protein n=1 Tax=Phaeodactylibacter luteus TaxID=1564516 RepID=A0A5C6S4U5_9BACT|nr:endonuclease/exonuclease/phosphatase family protein [Phaeodactylibacter luteus]TXB69516.1 endonuclease/exonuclease/phosphatase family protein [Phaeodactylibacter luteus]